MKPWPFAAIVCTFVVCATICFLFGRNEAGVTLGMIGFIVTIILGTLDDTFRRESD